MRPDVSAPAPVGRSRRPAGSRPARRPWPLALAAACAVLAGPGAAAAAGAAEAAAPAAAEMQAAAHVRVGLVSDATALGRGATHTLGLLFEVEPHWHVYWANPGDSGLPPRLTWTLPPGVAAGPLRWPLPQRLPVGPLMNFGYEGTVLLPLPLTVDAAVPEGPLAVEAEARWLVCAETCVPGRAVLRRALTVGPRPRPDAAMAARLAAATARLPAPLPAAWHAAARLDAAGLALTAQLPPGGQVRGADFFTRTPQLVAYAAAPRWEVAGDALTLRLPPAEAAATPPPARLAGVLTVTTAAGPQAYDVDLPLAAAATAATGDGDGAGGGGAEGPARAGTAPAAPAGPAGAAAPPTAAAADGAPGPPPGAHGAAPPEGAAAPTATAAAAPGGAPLSLPWALLLALVGGALLNLMPCVFPVLSLKVVGLARLAAAGDRAAARQQAWAYAAGVLVSFWALAAVLAALRLAGGAVGWGFQLQSPRFVTFLVLLLFGMGLSLLEVFEVGGALMGVGDGLARRQGLAGAFFTGVLATVVATPCTAPLMGPAMGFALTQPFAVTLAVFGALGAGMALPYVALVLLPGTARLLPRPGAWMQTFRQVLAFPLFATAVWLLWVLGADGNSAAIVHCLTGLLGLAACAWALGRQPPGGRGRRLALAAAAAVLLATLWAPPPRGTCRGGGEAADLPWEDYSAARLAALRAAGRPVFVDFTAAWCVSCQVNEAVVFGSQAVRDRLAAADVALLRADWTHQAPPVTAALAAFGRVGVPLYVVYGRDPAAPPQLLPEVLTPGLVLEALAGL